MNIGYSALCHPVLHRTLLLALLLDESDRNKNSCVRILNLPFPKYNLPLRPAFLAFINLYTNIELDKAKSECSHCIHVLYKTPNKTLGVIVVVPTYIILIMLLL